MASAPQVRPVHVPVLLRPLLEAVAPVSGLWLDGTFGAGGHARGLLEAGAQRVIGIDRDPSVFPMAAGWADEYGERLRFVRGTFGALDTYVDEPLDGVILDLGVSSMQLDRAERGFSFMKDGPLDMRMGAHGSTAADLVNEAGDDELADILHRFGEERRSRRIARAIVEARRRAPILTTKRLSEIVDKCLPRAKPSQSHPATRVFQAIRIAVNDEFGELARGLEAAERALKPGGRLAVVTFHSIEDRAIKRFFRQRSGSADRPNRHMPETVRQKPRFETPVRHAIRPDEREIAENPRARSAMLRVGLRTDAPAGAVDRTALGLPEPAFRETVRCAS